jgi:hypothetical protein
MERKELLIQFDSILFSAFFSSRKRLLKEIETKIFLLVFLSKKASQEWKEQRKTYFVKKTSEE